VKSGDRITLEDTGDGEDTILDVVNRAVSKKRGWNIMPEFLLKRFLEKGLPQRI